MFVNFASEKLKHYDYEKAFYNFRNGFDSPVHRYDNPHILRG